MLHRGEARLGQGVRLRVGRARGPALISVHSQSWEAHLPARACTLPPSSGGSGSPRVLAAAAWPGTMAGAQSCDTASRVHRRVLLVTDHAPPAASRGTGARARHFTAWAGSTTRWLPTRRA
jgi:hypothetical protein